MTLRDAHVAVGRGVGGGTVAGLVPRHRDLGVARPIQRPLVDVGAADDDVLQPVSQAAQDVTSPLCRVQPRTRENFSATMTLQFWGILSQMT